MFSTGPRRPTYLPTYRRMPTRAGCGDACPWMPAKHHIEWTIPDPKHMEPEEFNKASGRNDAVCCLYSPESGL